MTFSLSSVAGPGDTVRWTRNAIDISDGPTGNGSTYSGTGTDTLTITNVQLADASRYGARIDTGDASHNPNANNEDHSHHFHEDGGTPRRRNRARLTSAGFPNSFFVGSGPSFDVNPSDITVRSGFWIEFETRVSSRSRGAVTNWELLLGDPENSDPNLRSGRILQADTKIYTPSDGSVSAKLLFGPITAGDGGEFRLRVTNSDGSTASDTATLTVDTLVPERTVYVGERTIISAPVTNLGVLQYQWHKDYNKNNNSLPEESAISGATDTDYIIDSAGFDDAGLYSVVVTDPYKRNSHVYVLSLSVSQPPVAPTPLAITTQPAAVTVVEGEGASFRVAATGSRPLSYQWRKGGNAIANAIAETYTIASTELADAGVYSVVVTNEIGSATSADAT